jgi:ribosomal protein L3 glutamine methyltransferase
MNATELQARLLTQASNEGWVQAVAEHFAAADLHFGHGTDNATDEAFWLIRSVQGWDDLRWASPPDPTLAARVSALAQRRVVERRPLAYLLGEAWFAGLKFKADERALIPRSPLAEIIEAGFAPWCRLAFGDRVLDVGTGGGCLAIAAAHYCPGISVDATEIAPDALALAAENVALHGLQNRVRILEADLFPSARAEYRVIISNPPYVPTAVVDALPREYAHEPAGALAGGESGLEPVARLLDRAAEYLAADGRLIVEVGEVAEVFATRFSRLPVVWIEFERGGEGVFVVDRDDLVANGFGPSRQDRVFDRSD